MHQHRPDPKLQQERPYSGPVHNPENPAAHGGITRVDMCSCGAVRLSNVNEWHVECGDWVTEGDGQ